MARAVTLPATWILALQVLLALAYTACAHAASVRDDDRLAIAAVAALIAMLLAAPLAHRRWWAWALLPLSCWGAWALYRAGHAGLPLLLVPVAFVVLIAWWFARSLRTPQGALITRIVCALEAQPPERLEPPLLRYTRRLTAAWAGVLALLAAVNLLLALIATPDGLLAAFGVRTPLAITRAQWSWFANLANYGLIGGFFAAEYLIRKRLFPGRYRSFAEFVRKLAALGPTFWRDFLR